MSLEKTIADLTDVMKRVAENQEEILTLAKKAPKPVSTDEDEAPKKARRTRDEDEDEAPKKEKRASRRDADEDEDEAPPKKQARTEDDEDEDEAPKKPAKKSTKVVSDKKAKPPSIRALLSEFVTEDPDEEDDRNDFVEAIFDHLEVANAAEIEESDRERIVGWLEKKRAGKKVKFD